MSLSPNQKEEISGNQTSEGEDNSENKLKM